MLNFIASFMTESARLTLKEKEVIAIQITDLLVKRSLICTNQIEIFSIFSTVQVLNAVKDFFSMKMRKLINRQMILIKIFFETDSKVWQKTESAFP